MWPSNKISFVAIIIFLSVFLFPQISFATTAVSSCQTINQSGSYVLTNNLSANGTCITINANDVTLDCQEFSITGPGNLGYPNGISIGSKSNVNIKNCNIKKFYVGVNIIYSSGINITDSVFRFNGRAGVEFVQSSNVRVFHNSFSNNTWGVLMCC